MRKLMICASALLALLQVWPMVFGHHATGEAVAAAPAGHLIPAVATTQLTPIKASAIVSQPMPKGCYPHYRMTFNTCTKGDRACQLRAADQWDLCEATGTWPE